MLIGVGTYFGSKLREHRDSRGLSGNRLAMLSGLGQALENALELGRRPPSQANLEALAAVAELGAPLEMLQAWADLDKIGQEGIERIKKYAPEALGLPTLPEAFTKRRDAKFAELDEKRRQQQEQLAEEARQTREGRSAWAAASFDAPRQFEPDRVEYDEVDGDFAD